MKTVLLLILLSFMLLGALLFAISDSTPLAKPAQQVTPEVAYTFKLLTKQMQFATYYIHLHTMVISERQVDALFAIAARALPRISGDTRFSAQGSEIRITLHLPENPFGDYINLRLGLPASANGVELDYLTVGSLRVPGPVAHTVLEGAANLAFGGQEGSKLLNTIKRLQGQPQRLVITYQPTPHLDEMLVTALQRLQPWRDQNSDRASSAAIHHYYIQLCDGTSTGVRSLAEPLSTMFTLAAPRSSSADEAAAENRAALLAMAIFFGNDRFNTLVNAIDDKTIRRCQQRASATTLAGRKDLALHFIYSAAIRILADSHASFAVGELKEMMDALQGGSGFSFADLAADQSGIRFAERASEPASARQLQRVAAELVHEDYFLPDISDLPEAISQRQFKQQYGDSGGDRYTQQLDKIGDRINALPLYHPPQ